MDRRTKNALQLTLILGFILLTNSLYLGKENVFLLLNTDLGSFADTFFRYYTYAGDGIIWVPFVVMVFIWKRRFTLLVLTCIITSTLVAQLSKNIFFKGVERPSLAIKDQSFHSVEGVELHTLNSFPSGHTTTAFTIFLLAVIMFPDKRWVLPVGFCLALLVGYSRVYLAQHFPIDVAGGMISAVLATLTAWPVHRKWGDIKFMIRL